MKELSLKKKCSMELLLLKTEKKVWKLLFKRENLNLSTSDFNLIFIYINIIYFTSLKSKNSNQNKGKVK